MVNYCIVLECLASVNINIIYYIEFTSVCPFVSNTYPKREFLLPHNYYSVLGNAL